uniref:GDSL esterase/lipase At4g16230-like n=1 Tax=Nicotiana tabacum TaxID=4097 RepID=A0A1S3ZZ95_TOBAC
MGNPSYYRLAILGVVLQNLTICLAENVPANFVFGDSLVDVGNNNYIASLSKANFFPNGIDFGGPTGRYTNGRTIVDILGSEEVGFNLTPPYLAPTTSGPVVLQGVNYASGGGGILNESGQIFAINRFRVDLSQCEVELQK